MIPFKFLVYVPAEVITNPFHAYGNSLAQIVLAVVEYVLGLTTTLMFISAAHSFEFGVNV